MGTRPTHEQDFQAIAGLTNEFIRSTAVHFGYEPVTPEELAAVWRETRDRYPWLSAEVDGRFAGYAKAGAWRTRTAYQWTAEVGIYIEEWARGRGVGRTLYQALLDELRTRGFHSAIGGITLPNEPSVRLHEALGFKPVGVVRDAGHKLGAWHDVGFWQLILRDGAHEPRPL
jgi:phosphinothricin acetyltransferase